MVIDLSAAVRDLERDACFRLRSAKEHPVPVRPPAPGRPFPRGVDLHDLDPTSVLVAAFSH